MRPNENILQSNCTTIFAQAQNSNCLEQRYITKETRHLTTYVPKKTLHSRVEQVPCFSATALFHISNYVCLSKICMFQIRALEFQACDGTARNYFCLKSQT